MLQNIRSNLQGVAAKVVIGIICIPFVLFGVESLIGGGGSNMVAEVNGEKITNQQLSEAIFLQKRQLMSQMGNNINPSMLEDERLKGPALQSLIDRMVLMQAADDLGMAVSTRQLNQIIINNPQFQEDGEFSNTRFQQVLAGAGFSAEIFTRLYSSDMLVSQLSGGVINSGFITADELTVNAKYTQQSRDIRFITLPAEKIAKTVKASDEELQVFYAANEDLFQSTEKVSLEYLEIKRTDFITEVPEDDIKQAFENEVASAGGNEQREVAHILIEINDSRDAEAAAVLADDLTSQLDAGADFSALAKAHSDDFGSRDTGGNLGVLVADAFPAEFVVAANALEIDQISAAIKTDAGIHLIKLTALTKADLPVYEERKAALKEELGLAKADPVFWQAVDDLKDLSFNSVDLNDPALDLELKVKTSALLERRGGQGIFANRQLMAAAFSNVVLKEGQDSDVSEITGDHVVVVRIKEHKPAALLPFNDVASDVQAAVIKDKADALLQTSVASLLKKLQEGVDVEVLAKQEGYAWQLLLATTRSAQVAPMDRQVLNAAFSLPVASQDQRAVDSLKLMNGDYVVLAVDNVTDGSADKLSTQEQQAMASYLSRAKSSELFQSVQEQLKAVANIDIL
ncbi:MAG: SurA N-terminal domain-containing protein [Pseudomonadales bacterium]|nr:SurA N-terminal domain-containing protein [Pseudomonadales bacterium]